MNVAPGTSLDVFRKFTAIEGAIPSAAVVVRPLDFVRVTIVHLTSGAFHDGH
jgi:hypothetical protein